MNILLDTCTFLWITLAAPALSQSARQIFRDPSHVIYLSAISAWEISVKYSLGRLPLPVPPEAFIPAQRLLHHILPLPFHESAALAERRLPRLHKDPFDRMLICQAIVDGMTILTPDPFIRQYPVPTVW